MITAYLGNLADTLSYGTLIRRIAAIAYQHRQHGLAAPATDPARKALLREVRGAAIRRRRPRPPSSLLGRMATTCPGDLAGRRDRPLLSWPPDGAWPDGTGQPRRFCQVSRRAIR